MKQERIDELLKGTDYGDTTELVYEDVDIESRSYSIQTVMRGEQRLCEDAALNAARVQLLAKALRSIAGNTCCVGCQEAKKVAAHCLAEAGLDKEPA